MSIFDKPTHGDMLRKLLKDVLDGYYKCIPEDGDATPILEAGISDILSSHTDIMTEDGQAYIPMSTVVGLVQIVYNLGWNEGRTS